MCFCCNLSNHDTKSCEECRPVQLLVAAHSIVLCFLRGMTNLIINEIENKQYWVYHCVTVKCNIIINALLVVITLLIFFVGLWMNGSDQHKSTNWVVYHLYK